MNRLLAYVLLISFGLSCGRPDSNEEYILSERDIIPGLGTVIHAEYGITRIDLRDYVLDLSLIDSVEIDGNRLSIDSGMVTLADWPTSFAMDGMDIWSQDEVFTIPIMRSSALEVPFAFSTGGRQFSSVKIKGEMTNWSTEEVTLEEKDGVYSSNFILEPGDYQYIMYIDGAELLDFNNPKTAPNGLGGQNSVLSAGSTPDTALWISARTDATQIVIVPNLSSEVQYLALWEDQLLEIEQGNKAVFVHIPERAKQKKRSHIRIWAYDDEQVSNDILVPLEQGMVLSSIAELERSDKHAMSLYNVFVDRFYNGDTANDRPLNMPSVHPRADDHGGDIRGLIDKMEAGFFDSLSINTIWISPIVKNAEGAWGQWPNPDTKFSAYHGYWPVSFTLIDDRKGTAAELHELVDKAHARGMNVLLDFVANHVHEAHPFYMANMDLATNLYLPDGRLNTELWDEQRLTTWFDVFMPTLKLDEPRVYEMLSDSALFWMKEYDLDGFRHDATKHVPEIFWKTLTKKLKAEMAKSQKSLYQIGETYGPPSLISSYVNSGQLDAQFDFNVYDAMVASICDTTIGFERLDNEIKRSLKTYGHHHLMGNITGNQDRGRFISYAGGALSFQENSKVAGWSREVRIGDEQLAYARSKILFGLVATVPGLPVVYYGDELGSYGGNDPDNRKMMQFSDLNHAQSDLRTVARGALAQRRQDLNLIYGDFRTHYVSESAYVFSRNYLHSSTWVAINTSDKGQELFIDVDENQDHSVTLLRDQFSGYNSSLAKATLYVPAHSFIIISRP